MGALTPKGWGALTPKAGRAEQTGPRQVGRGVGPRDARPSMYWREGGRAEQVL